MANYNSLKTSIRQVIIPDNHANEIDGGDLLDSLLAMINSLGAGYQFAGVATPSTNPGTPDQNVFYITASAGSYSNFNSIVVADDELAVLTYNGSWSKSVIGGVTKEQLAKVTQDLGLNTLARLIDGEAVKFEQGEIDTSGANTSNYNYIRTIKSLPKPFVLAAPEGFVIHAVFYYNSWTDATTFSFGEREYVGASQYIFDKNYPVVRIVFRKTVVGLINVSEFLRAFNLMQTRLVEVLPVDMQPGFNYNTDNGRITPTNNASTSLIVPYIDNPYTNILTFGYECNVLYWSNGTYLGWSRNSLAGPTTWVVQDHTLPITHIAFGLYGIPNAAVYYCHPSPEILYTCGVTLDSAKAFSRSADFRRAVILNSAINDENGQVISISGYARTDKFDFIPDAKTNAMEYEVGTCETLYYSGDTYLGYTKNAPYANSPAVWVSPDHTLPVTHVAFCWNSVDIDGLYYIVGTSAFADKSYTDGKVAELKTYVDQQDGGLSSAINDLSSELSAAQDDISGLEDDVVTIGQDIETINEALSELSGELPPGAVTGNNVWTGTNQFTQPITGVSGQNGNNVALLSQLWNASVAHRFVNAKDYGFLSTNTASANVTALQNALAGGSKTVVISEPGTYKLDDTILLSDNTIIIFGKGVLIQKDAAYQNMFRNAGAATRTYNENISLIGLTLSINGKASVNSVDGELFGLRGEVAFLCARNIQIRNFTCTDLGTSAYAIQVNQSENILIENFIIRGQKDGVHLSSCESFVVRNGRCQTNDDALALNACDWVSSNCVDGTLKDGLIENVIDEAPVSTPVGFTLRLLVGAWKDWELGMQIHRGDTVVNGGKIYRAYTASPTDTIFTSATEPTIATFSGKQEDTGGFYWKLMRSDSVYYSASIENLTIRNLRSYSSRRGIAEEVDTADSYNRSLYPGLPYSDYPRVSIDIQDFYFENINYDCMRLVPNCHSYWRIAGMSGAGARIILGNPVDSAVLKRMDASGIDFRKNTSGANKVQVGANAELHLDNCVYSGALTISSAGRTVGNCNLASLPGDPAKGDYVIHQQVPKIFNGSSWISLI